MFETQNNSKYHKASHDPHRHLQERTALSYTEQHCRKKSVSLCYKHRRFAPYVRANSDRCLAIRNLTAVSYFVEGIGNRTRDY